MALGIGDVYRVTARWTMAGQICYNVMHFRSLQNQSSQSGVNANLDALLTRMENIMTAVSAVVHEDVHYEWLNATAVRWASDPHFREKSIDFDGSQSGELLPGFNAIPIYLNTGLAGRSRRGRFHMGGLLEAHQDAGQLVQLGITAVNAVRTVIDAQTASQGTWEGGVWSRLIAQGREPSEKFPEGVPPNPADAFRNIASTSNGTIVGSMYSRKIGRGA